MFCWGWKLLWMMSVGFENSCTALGKPNVSRVIPSLYGRLFPSADEHSVVVMTVGCQSRRY